MRTTRRLSPSPRLPVAYLLAAAIVFLGCAGAASDADAAGRAEQAWCAFFSGDYGLVDCGYATYAQCHATVFGPGGYCSPNPRVVVIDETWPPPRRRRR